MIRIKRNHLFSRILLITDVGFTSEEFTSAFETVKIPLNLIQFTVSTAAGGVYPTGVDKAIFLV